MLRAIILAPHSGGAAKEPESEEPAVSGPEKIAHEDQHQMEMFYAAMMLEEGGLGNF